MQPLSFCPVQLHFSATGHVRYQALTNHQEQQNNLKNDPTLQMLCSLEYCILQAFPPWFQRYKQCTFKIIDANKIIHEKQYIPFPFTLD